MKYESIVEKESAIEPGVRYRVKRMSFGRRLELTRRVRDALGRIRFLESGEGSEAEQAEAAILGAEVDGEYLRWGLAEVKGLELDGAAATPETLLASGPEELVREALGLVMSEARLNETDRKNSESHSTSSRETKPGGVATNAAA